MSNYPGMKTIDYRGGLVRFLVPAHWTEEYEPEGGGAFYDRDVPAVTLRLNVLTLRATLSASRSLR